MDEVLGRYFRIVNGDLYQKRIRHYCCGCHGSRDDVIKELVQILEDMFVSTGVPPFITTRWLKLGPSLKWFGRALLPNSILTGVLDFFKCVEEEDKDANLKGGKAGKAKGKGKAPIPAAAQAQADADAKRDDLGNRLKKARVKFADSRCRFHVATCLFHQRLFEPFATLLFAISSIKLRREKDASAGTDILNVCYCSLGCPSCMFYVWG